MASEVDICNLALGHLGDSATVSSISPPEGSAQAEHCARFYPIARDLTLEAHEWGFATKRMNMALLGSGVSSDLGATGITPPPEWTFVYAMPTDCRNIIKLIDPNAMAFYPGTPRFANWEDIAFDQGPVPYEQEVLDDGTNVVYTNLPNAIIQYVASITDTTKFTSQFVDALAWLLAAYLAGPVVKGEEGIAAGQAAQKQYVASLGAAKGNDANNRRRRPDQSQRAAPWVANR